MTCFRVALGGNRTSTRTCDGLTDAAATIQFGSRREARIERSQNLAVAGIFNSSRRLYMVQITWYHF
jgi:hypothetical protein